MTYAAAKAQCESEIVGSTFLSSIKDRYEQAFVEVLLYINDVESGWFGLERDGVRYAS